MHPSLIVAGLGFVLMGGIALLRPGLVFLPFRASAESPDIRNEIRAVYGGFGLSIGTLLLVSGNLPELQAGIATAVVIALLGMALGRVVGFVLEPTGPWPWLFCGIEIGLALWLAASAI